MNAIAKFENLKDLIVELRGQSVLREVDWYKKNNKSFKF